MLDCVDQESGGDFEELFQGSEGGREMTAGCTTYERMNEDLCTLLTGKTEGEAALRVRGCNPDQGANTYMVVHKWFMGAAGQAVTDRTKSLCPRLHPKLSRS